MAASNAPVLSELKSNFLNCALCLDDFQTPRMLDCLHTYCEACLQNYAFRNELLPGDYLRCPVCRAETKIPRGGLQKLKSNFHISKLSDFISSQMKDKTESDELKPFMSAINLRCETHNRDCEMFCNATACQTAFCVRCASKHSGHPIESLEEKALQMKTALKKSKDKFQEDIAMYRSNVVASEEDLKEMGEYEQKSINQVKKVLQTIVDYATKRSEFLISEISKGLEPEKTGAHWYKQHLESKISSAERSIKLIDQLLGTEEVKDFLSMGGAVIGDIQGELSFMNVGEVPKSTARVCYSDPSVDKEQIESLMGSIVYPAQQEADHVFVSSEPVPITEEVSEHLQEINQATPISPISPYYIGELLCRFSIEWSTDWGSPHCIEMCFGEDETLAIADIANKRVKMYDILGRALHIKKYRFLDETLTSIAWNHVNREYIVTGFEQRFHTVARNGFVSRRPNLMAGLESPIATSVLPDGDLVALDSGDVGSISVWNCTGEVCFERWNISEQAQGMITGGENIIIKNSNITAYERDGRKLWEHTGNRATSLCSDPDGNVLMSYLFPQDGEEEEEEENKAFILNRDSGQNMGCLPFISFYPKAIAMSRNFNLALWNAGTEEIEIWKCIPVSPNNSLHSSPLIDIYSSDSDSDYWYYP